MIVGREKEIKLLQGLFEEEESQFVAVSGRRRVGKTFLIREAFNYNFAFQHTGIYGATLREQLDEFTESLYSAGMRKTKDIPNNWNEAFHLLERFIDKSKSKQKKVIFIDEMPWMDTHKSNFVRSLDHFWISTVHSWVHKPKNSSEKGAQIDLLIDRNDQTINLCEIKYANAPYSLDAEEDMKLRNRKATFIKETGTTKSILITMITTYGLTHGGYSDNIHCQVTMKDLFK